MHTLSVLDQHMLLACMRLSDRIQQHRSLILDVNNESCLHGHMLSLVWPHIQTSSEYKCEGRNKLLRMKHIQTSQWGIWKLSTIKGWLIYTFWHFKWTWLLSWVMGHFRLSAKRGLNILPEVAVLFTVFGFVWLCRRLGHGNIKSLLNIWDDFVK